MSKLSVLISAAVIAAGAFAAEYKYYTGGAGTTKWSNDWNAAKDADTGNALWSSGVAPLAGNGYVIDKNIDWIFFKISTSEFLGDSLTIASKQVELNANDYYYRLTVNNLSVKAGALLQTLTVGGYSTWPHGLWLTGTPRIDGTLQVDHRVDKNNNYFGARLSGNLSGEGLINFRGDTKSSPKIKGQNWRIAGDNANFKGKFLFGLSEAKSGGEAFATGVEILNDNALGGARDSATPDAVTIMSWNGLVAVDSDITLNAANSGILMQTNSFFEVQAGRVLTVAEPIRLTGGFFKKGAGTLALTGGFTFGADGTAAADGANSALAVKEGVLRVTQADDLEDLDVTMANGTTLELAGTTTAQFRSLNAAGTMTLLVDCTGLTAGSTQTITLTIPQSDAEALVGKVDVMAKGNVASLGGELTVTATGATVTLKVPSVTTWHNHTGTSGTSKYNTYWNNVMDGDDATKYLWDSHLAAVGTDGYVFNRTFEVFMCNPSRFNGGALHVKSNTLSVEGKDMWRFVVSNLTVSAEAKFRPEYRDSDATWPTWIEGELWRIDGEVNVIALTNGYGCLTVPMIGSGLVTFSGWGWGSTKARDQRLESDNSHFRGKFKVALPGTSTGPEKAAGLRIVNAKALGGALGVMTPDALTLAANNGLVVAETLTLATENRGILMWTNAFFEVASDKTLTLAEPIRVVNGILKKGAGTLALGGDVTIGEDGATAPSGTNNKLTVQAGTLKAASTNGIAKLAIEFATGTKLALDAFPADDGVKASGFYFAGDTAFTAADAKIPLSIDFPAGYLVEKEVDVVLCTVKSDNAAFVMNKLAVTATGLARKCTRSFWTEDAGNGLTRIGYKFVRSGLVLVIK